MFNIDAVVVGLELPKIDAGVVFRFDLKGALVCKNRGRRGSGLEGVFVPEMPDVGDEGGTPGGEGCGVGGCARDQAGVWGFGALGGDTTGSEYFSPRMRPSLAI